MINIKKGVFFLLIINAVLNTTVFLAQNDASLIKKANAEFQAGNYNLAITEYRQFLAKDPKNIDFNFKYATCLYYTDNINNATKFYDFILNQYDPPVESYFFRGKIYQNNYDFQNATKCFEKYKDLKGKKDIDLGAEKEINYCKQAATLLKNPGSLKTIKRYSANKSDFFKTYVFPNFEYSFYSLDEVFEKQNSKKNFKPTYAFVKGMKYRFFASYGSNLETGKDIYIQKKNAANEWEEPIRLDNQVNSEGDEDYPFFDEVNGILYFSSNGPNSIGGYDLFKVSFDLSGNLVSNKEHLMFPYSSPNDDLFFIPDHTTNTAYFASNRNGELNKVEVFLIEISDKPVQTMLLAGKLTDYIDELNKNVQINLKNELSNEQFGPFYSDLNGNYLLAVPKAGKYYFTIKVSGSEKTFEQVVEIPELDPSRIFEQELVYSMKDSKENLEIINRFSDITSLNPQLELRKYKEIAKLDVNAATLITETSTKNESTLSVYGYQETDTAKAFEKLSDDLLEIELDIEKNIKFQEELTNELTKNEGEIEKLNQQLVKLENELKNTTDPREKYKLETDKRNLEGEIQKIKKQNFVLANEIKAIEENQVITKSNYQKIKQVNEEINEHVLSSDFNRASSIVSENQLLLKTVLNLRLEDKEKVVEQKENLVKKEKQEIEDKINDYSNQITTLKNEIKVNEQKLKTEKNKKEQERISNALSQQKKNLSLVEELNNQAQFELARVRVKEDAYIENKSLIQKIDERAEQKTSISNLNSDKKVEIKIDDLLTEITDKQEILKETSEGKYEYDIKQIQNIENEVERVSKLKEREIQYQNELKQKLASTSIETEKEILSEQLQLSQSRLLDLDEQASQNNLTNNQTNKQNSNTNNDSKLVDTNSNENNTTNDQTNNQNSNTNNDSKLAETNSNEKNTTHDQTNNENSNTNNDSKLAETNSNEKNTTNDQTNNQNSNNNNDSKIAETNSNEKNTMNDQTNNQNSNTNNDSKLAETNSNSENANNEVENSNNSSENVQLKPEDLKQAVLYNLTAAKIEEQISIKRNELNNAKTDKEREKIKNDITKLESDSKIEYDRGIRSEKIALFNKQFANLEITTYNELKSELNEVTLREQEIQQKINQTSNDREKNNLKEQKNQLAAIKIELENKIESTNQKVSFKVEQPEAAAFISESETESLRLDDKYQKYIEDRTTFNLLISEYDRLIENNTNLRELIKQKLSESESNELSEEIRQLAIQLSENDKILSEKQLQIESQFTRLKSFENYAKFERLIADKIQPTVRQLAKNESSELISNFSIGRNPTISIDKPLPVNVSPPSGLVYRVQVGAFRKPIPKESFRDFSPVSGDVLANGLTCYMAGYFNSAQNAILARKQIRALGYADAFIVAYCDGKRVSFAQGRELENSGRCKVMTINELNLALVGNNPDNLSNIVNVNSENRANTNQPIKPNYLDVPNAKSAELGELNQHLFFTVQVGVYNKPITNNQLQNIDELITHKSEKGQIRYSTGMFDNLNAAKKRKIDAVNKGVADAYVVAYYQGKRISIAEATNLLARNGDQILKKKLIEQNNVASIQNSNGKISEIQINLPKQFVSKQPETFIQYELVCDSSLVVPNLERLNRIGIFTYQPEEGKIVSSKLKSNELTQIHQEYLKQFKMKNEEIDSTLLIQFDVTEKMSNGVISDWLLRSDLIYRLEVSEESKKLNVYLKNEAQREVVLNKANELLISEVK